MDRRVFGIETEYGITFSSSNAKPLAAEEAARYLFRQVVSWGRSSNIFLPNGSRLYLDVGSHPEYATAECDGLSQVIAQDRAGERILDALVPDAEERLRADGFHGQLYLLKNNTDSVGNSYGCHENYLVTRKGEFLHLAGTLIPFLVTRQMIVGAGKLHIANGQARYGFSQRAEHMWEGVSAATTRSRPMINTRDEPHADPQKYRRLHVIVGDSNMSETTTLLKVGVTDLLLRMIEDHHPLTGLELVNPVRSIRAISADFTGKAPVELKDGSTATALDIQYRYLQHAQTYLEQHEAHHQHIPYIMDLWERTLAAIEQQDFRSIDTEIDWAIKKRLLEEYQDRHDLSAADLRLAQIDMTYHDISPQRGLFAKLRAHGRAAAVVTEEEIRYATEHAPATTRAALRSAFIRAAQAAGREYTVDWAHLKLNAPHPRSVICQDPFAVENEQVTQVIAALQLD